MPTSSPASVDALAAVAADHLQRLAPDRFADLRLLLATARAIADEARAQGLGAIDHLIGSPDGLAFHAVQGRLDDPLALRAYIGRAQFDAHAARARSLEVLRTTGERPAYTGGLWTGVVRQFDPHRDPRRGA